MPEIHELFEVFATNCLPLSVMTRGFASGYFSAVSEDASDSFIAHD